MHFSFIINGSTHLNYAIEDKIEVEEVKNEALSDLHPIEEPENNSTSHNSSEVENESDSGSSIEVNSHPAQSPKSSKRHSLMNNRNEMSRINIKTEKNMVCALLD